MSSTKRQYDERLLMILAAQLRSQGLEQREIVEKIRWKKDGAGSQSTVSRLLKEAVEADILAKAPQFIRKGVTDDDLRMAKAKFSRQPDDVGKKVEALVQSRVHFQVSVFGSERDDFIQMAAGRVLELIHDSHRIGVMWGRTVAAIVKGISERTKISRPVHSPDDMCIPLCGDPVHLMNLWEVEYSASHLAASLESALTGDRNQDRPCLSGVPAYVAHKHLKTGAFQDFLNSIPGYEAIFGRRTPSGRPLIDSVDTIISGLGIVASEAAKKHETAAFIRERAHQEELHGSELRKLLLGDIGGLLVERPGLSASDQRRVNDLNKGWIGMTFKHLERVANEAKPNSAPGVIAIVHGVQKAPLVAEILRRGCYLNQLICSSDLCEELQRLLKR